MTWVDLGAGVMTGFYGPFAQRVRNYDCFGEFFNWMSELVTWHVTFYGWWELEDPMSWVFISTNGLAQLWGGFRAFDVCMEQYYYSRTNMFLQNMQAETTTTKEKSGWEFSHGVSPYGYDMYFDTIYIIAIVNNAMNVYFGVINIIEGNSRYYYEIGHNGALLITRILMLCDKVLPLYMFTPTKPWIRFKTQ